MSLVDREAVYVIVDLFGIRRGLPVIVCSGSYIYIAVRLRC